MPTDDLATRLDALVGTLRGYGSTVVAFSGGVDSAVVAKAAFLALGENAIAAMSDSPTVPRSEVEEAARTAHGIGIRFYAVERTELDDPRFVENPLNRCYFCKKGLQEDLQSMATEIGAATVTYGVNVDDLGDWRPGIEGAKEGGARFPLVEAGFTKGLVRDAARHWGLPNWDKPASPCLASRIPYGEMVTEGKMKLVEDAEAFVRGLGFRDVRVRHMDGVARIEVPAADVPRLFAIEPFLHGHLKGLGFLDVTLDPRGLRSGRLNEEAMIHGAADH